MIEAEHAGHWHVVLEHRQDIGVVAERIKYRIEQRAREDWSPEIAHAFRIDGIMLLPVERGGTGTHGHAIGEPLAHLGALLARNPFELLLIGIGTVGNQIGDEPCMRVRLDRPARVLRQHAAAQFERRCAMALALQPGRLCQSCGGCLFMSQNAAIHGEARRDDRAPEQRRMHDMQRQIAGQRAGSVFGHQCEQCVPGGLCDSLAPGQAVKCRGSGVRLDPGVQARAFARFTQQSEAHRWRGPPGRREMQHHSFPAASGSAISSIRHQLKSRVSRSSLPAMASSPV